MKRRVMRVPLDYDTPECPWHLDPRTLWDQDTASPPEGDAYQLWMTTNMVPLSPVFVSPDELVDWLTSEPRHIGLAGRAVQLSPAAARRFVEEGNAATIIPAWGMSGIEALNVITKAD